MIEATAILKFARVSTRKVRLVVNQIRGKSVAQASEFLEYNNRRTSAVVKKLLDSAIANAENKGADIDMLVVKETYADEGPKIKRWRPRAQGRATPIHKPTSHIFIKLEETE